MDIYDKLLSTDGICKKYAIRYIKFIQSRPKIRILEYSENHHILPKSLFPEYEFDFNNIINLTPKEHYVAHHLLYRVFPTSHLMLRAFWGMCNGWQDSSTQNRFKPLYTSKIYDELKQAVSREMSKKMTKNNPYSQQKIKDKIIKKYGGLGNSSDIIFNKQKQTMIDRYGVDNYFKIPEFISTIAERNRDSWKDPCAKELRIANIKKGLMNRPILKCPHCGKKSKNNSNMSRYHFDKCKFLSE